MRQTYGWGLVALAALGGCNQLFNINEAERGWTGSSNGSAGGTGDGGSGGAPSTTTSSTTGSGASSGTGGAPACPNGKRDGNETDVDCGGGTCPACALGQGCLVGPDCESNICLGGTCVTADCADKIKNGSETDIDCGGSCQPCADGKACVISGDCTSGNCTGTICGPVSCAGGGAGISNCGPTGDESCCTSLSVPGGMFHRSYDGVTFTDMSAPATVSSFRLDKYEVTVGRFRKFVTAWIGGWRPAAGAGKHQHLNGGGGLNSGTEPGWDTAWASNLATTAGAWGDADHLAYDPADHTWTPSAGSNENRPINCIAWYEAYAFCIWDGGFLPTEAEWNYTAAGGSEQRVYPWSSPANSTTINETYASYYVDSLKKCYGDGVNGCSLTDFISVGTKPSGNGTWGHADLAGNVFEWVLDLHENPYGSPCDNCSNLTSGSNRVFRGGAYNSNTSNLRANARASSSPTARYNYYGARCARTP